MNSCLLLGAFLNIFICTLEELNPGRAISSAYTETLSLEGEWILKLAKAPESISRTISIPPVLLHEGVPASVPGTVQQSLVKNALQSDPYMGRQVEEIRWVEACQWEWYRGFDWKNTGSHTRVDLVLDGISYTGQIFLNGQWIGSTDGMFSRHRIALQEHLREGENTLSILVEGPVPAGPKGISNLRALAASHLVCPMWGKEDGTSPSIFPLGIWRSVRIETWRHVRLSKPYIRVLSQNGPDTLCEIECVVEDLEPGITASHIQVDFVKKLGSPQRGKTVAWDLQSPLSKGMTLKETFLWKDPSLWWPIGMGEQALYICTFVLMGEDQNILSHSSSLAGLRTISWNHSATRPHERWIKINGQKMNVRGSTWFPMDSILSWERYEYERMLSLVRHAGINMLRIWGGGICENEDFYRYCDHYGILLLQEFWLSESEYQWLPRDLFIKTAGQELRRLRTHPSVGFLCGGDYLSLNCQDKLDIVENLEELSLNIAPDRPFLPSFPGKEMYKINGQEPSDPYHMPCLMNGDMQWVIYFQSLPHKALISCFGNRTQGGFSPEDWTCRGANFRELSRHTSLYGFPRNHHQFYLRSRMAQAMQVQQLTLTHRMLEQNMVGSLGWRFNDSWPSVSSSLVDYSGSPKPAYYTLRRAVQPLAVGCIVTQPVVHRGQSISGKLVGFVPLGEQEDVSGISLHGTLFTHRGEMLWSREWVSRPVEGGFIDFGNLSWTVPEEMKRTVFLLFLILKSKEDIARSCSLFGTTDYKIPEQWTDLAEGWRFMPDPAEVGERKGWHLEDLDDSTWEGIRVNIPWDQQGYQDYRGTAWYRRRIDMDPAFREFPFEVVFHSHGKTKVFWNGKEMDVKVKAGQESKEYRCSLPEDRILWGQLNLLALRVKGDDKGSGLYHDIILRPWIPDSVLGRLLIQRNTALAPLASMPRCTLELETVAGQGLLVRNLGPSPSFGIWIDAPPPGFCDNLLFLLPGEEETLYPIMPWNLDKVRIEVTAWNAEPQKISIH